MNPIQRAFWTAKSVGWDNVPRRILHSIHLRSGSLLRKTAPSRFSQSIFQGFPASGLNHQPTLWSDVRSRFFPLPSPHELEAITAPDRWTEFVVTPCQNALSGRYLHFSHWYGDLGWPPDFNRDPVHDIEWPVGEHWTRTAKSGLPRDDIKLVWESNRLSLAYLFARAYLRSGDEEWSTAFWQLFDAWVAQNPVQRTVAWGCGQEVAFRLMALLTGAAATLDSPEATSSRLRSLALLCWQSARRIHANINYAISQGNNHALSEALGLWTIGLLFPDLPESSNWRTLARHLLVRECRRQIYSDGSYVQQSMNYHRVMLDDLMWCIRLGEINDAQLPQLVYQQFARACDWLTEMTDDISGGVPNYGSNDGANVLPLSCTDYVDFRPTVQTANWIAHKTRCFPTGPWDEKLLWLCGRDSLSSASVPKSRVTSWCAPEGGYYILRGTRTWLMTRCGRFRDRPHQADLLHVDLWCRGKNILRDGGTYAYYHADHSLQHYFHSTAAHNTVELDGRDQMIKGPRFLWFCWPEGRLVDAHHDKSSSTLVFDNLSYRWLDRHVRHRRTIERQRETYVITDTLESKQPHAARIRWRLPDVDWNQNAPDDTAWNATFEDQLICIRVNVQSECPRNVLDTLHQAQAPPNTLLIRGQTDPPEGWESLYYGSRSPSPVLIVEVEIHQPVTVVTTIEC